MDNNSKNLISMGIDPGLRNTGWGIISSYNNKISYLNHGVIKPSAYKTDGERLNKIFIEIRHILLEYKPLVVCIENIFVSNNANSALKLGMARGIALAAVASFNIIVNEISAKKVKKSITGSGAADKNQVKYIVQKILMKTVSSDDASDALALAIAGSYQNFIIENQIKSKLDLAIDKALLSD